MEAVLRIEIQDEASVAVARDAVRTRGAELGLDELAREAAANAASELAHNQLRHARRGTIELRAITRGGFPGLEIAAADEGPGIADPTAAILGSSASRTGLGVGLSAAYRLVDELDIDTRAGEGTRIRARKLTGDVPRREVATLGRACPGESISGDHAGVIRDGDVVWIALCDGLGHGPLARTAANAALAIFHGAPADDPGELLARIDAALVGTRGAVMSIARIDLAASHVDHAGVGNVTTRLVTRGHVRILRAVAGSLGTGARPRRIPVERTPISDGEVLVMTTDGLRSRIDLEETPAVLQQPPLAIADHVLREFARSNDDALVVVVR